MRGSIARGADVSNWENAGQRGREKAQRGRGAEEQRGGDGQRPTCRGGGARKENGWDLRGKFRARSPVGLAVPRKQRGRGAEEQRGGDGQRR